MKSKLLPFYYGTINEEQRLVIERELLTDSEVLVDYLDLKRAMESAETVPAASPKVWYRLKKQIVDRRRVVFPLSIGLAFFMMLLIFGVVHHKRPTAKPAPHEMLFDSNNELQASSGVL